MTRAESQIEQLSACIETAAEKIRQYQTQGVPVPGTPCFNQLPDPMLRELNSMVLDMWTLLQTMLKSQTKPAAVKKRQKKA